ncbi:MAG: ATP-binding protein [Chloroflexota bacterium]
MKTDASSLRPHKPDGVTIFQQAKQWLTHLFALPETPTKLPNADLAVQILQGRNRILTYMLRIAALLGILTLMYLTGDTVARQNWQITSVYMVIAISIGLVSFIPRIGYHVRAVTFLTIVFLLGNIDLVFFGVAEDWRLYFSAFAILATIFLGWRAGVTAIVLSLTAFVAIAWQIAQKNIVITASTLGNVTLDMHNIIAMSLAFALTNSLLVAAITTLLHEFENATRKEHETAVSLRQKTAELEHSLRREQKLARELTFALHQAQELSQLRATILTTVSHEFRTPLTIINNSASLLNNYYDRLSPEKRQAHYERIHNAIFYLDHLLQDVSLVEHAQKEDVSFHPSPMQFGAFYEQLSFDLLQQNNHPSNVQFQRSGPPTATLVIDYKLVNRVVANLLVNALTFSASNAPICVHVQVEELLTIAVIDQGMGVLVADREKIWGLFQRGSNVETRRGLGLGLFIVQQLLETMSGSITVTENPQGQGTIFTVRLPISPID